MSFYEILFEIVNFSVLGIWLLTEIIINTSKRGDKKIIKARKEKMSNSLILAVGIISIVVAISIGFLAKFMDIKWLYSPDYFISGIGRFLIICGVLIRWLAVLTLKKYFTVDVVIMDDHKLVKSGLFKYIRHPSYLGILITVLGFGISMVNWLSIIVILVPHIIIIFLRIKEEELALSKHFGQDYEIYRENTRQLIPFVL